MAAFIAVAETGEIAPGRVKVVEVDGRRIALCNVDGEFFAIDDVCPPAGGSLDQGELYDNVIECPRHGARFDVKTGKVLALPAVKPVNTYAVRVDGVRVEGAL